jgi:hypothetical protein
MNSTYRLTKSPRAEKKFMVVTPSGKRVYFGATGYSDYTIHKDFERMQRYNIRHQKRENWTKSGIETAGFWSKWLLWNKPSLIASLRDMEKKFKIKIMYR